MSMSKPSRLSILAAYAAIYIIWGSTYLVIRIGIETIPPNLLAATRFLAAGIPGLFLFQLRSKSPVSGRQWANAVLIGTLMLAGGNGLVTWAELRVPSSIAALLITSVPLWMVLLDAFVWRRAKMSPAVWLGLISGVGGVVLLVGPSGADAAAVDPLGAAALVLASLFWALGSLYSRGADQPASPLLSVSMQMVGGGAVLLLVSVLRGEFESFVLADVSRASALATLYLTFLGSIVALSCYVWLLRHQPASSVSTYAFVNPIVAVILGWAVAGEQLGPRTLIAGVLIVGAVLLIHYTKLRSTRGVKKHAPELVGQAEILEA